MTQAERVLAALRRAGDHGLTQADFLRYPTIDGGPAITRLAARIQDLKDQGHQFCVPGKRQKLAVYVLVEGVSDESGRLGGPAPLLGSSETLFDPAAGRRVLGPYDDVAA